MDTRRRRPVHGGQPGFCQICTAPTEDGATLCLACLDALCHPPGHGARSVRRREREALRSALVAGRGTLQRVPTVKVRAIH